MNKSQNVAKATCLTLATAVCMSQPMFANSPLNDGIALYTKGKYQAAEIVLKQAEESDRFNSHVHYYLANCYARLGNGQQAIEEYTRCLQTTEPRCPAPLEAQYAITALKGYKYTPPTVVLEHVLSNDFRRAFTGALENRNKQNYVLACREWAGQCGFLIDDWGNWHNAMQGLSIKRDGIEVEPTTTNWRSNVTNYILGAKEPQDNTPVVPLRAHEDSMKFVGPSASPSRQQARAGTTPVSGLSKSSTAAKFSLQGRLLPRQLER